ncbi:MAG: hypothetical protein ACE5FJ_00365 [Gemmatimonadales bacterium]
MGLAPRGAPQMWQNLAPALSGEAQFGQAVPPSDPPQLLQNFPELGAPQCGHCVVVDVMNPMYQVVA